MTIGWNTYQQLTPPICVQYGTACGNLSHKACSHNSSTYGSSRTYFNAVDLTGLKPATTYHYKIVSTNSSVEHFLSPRPAGDKTPFNMDVVIDLGVYGENGFTTKRDDVPIVQPALTHTTIGQLARTVNDYEFVLHPGDFAYADDWILTASDELDGRDAFEAIIENFYGQLAPVAGRKAYMASPGNHEADCQEIPHTSGLCAEGQSNFTDFMHRFGKTMPKAFASTSRNASAKASAALARSLAVPPFWFSFEYGMAHVVMINTETDFPSAPDGQNGSAGLNGGPFGAPGQQLRFLEADLASVDRRRTPWVIVGGHRPWYSTGGSSCEPCQAAFEPLLYKYGVDLAIFGHVHNSQRFDPIYGNVSDPAGLNDPRAPMYVVAGGAGNIEGLSAVGANATANKFAYAADYSFAQVKFMDANHLGVQFFDSSNGTLLDSSVLYKSHSSPFVVQS